MRAESPGTESRLQGIDKLIDPVSGLGGNSDTSGKSPAVDRGQVRIFQEIDFVESNQRLFAESVEFFDDTVDRCHLLIHSRMAQIYHVNEQIGFAHFLERGFEGFDQRVRQFAQKSHRVSEQNTLFVRQSETARGRIKGGKKFIDCENVSSGQQVQQ